MSGRKLISRKKRVFGRRTRAVTTLWGLSDDVPLAQLQTPKSTRGRKKSTPRKSSRRAKPAPTKQLASEVINLDDTDSVEILNNVNTKVGDFLQSGSFISSDEEEVEMIKAKTNKKAHNAFFISDDSDDDLTVVKDSGSTLNLDSPKPSTSTSMSKNITGDNNRVSLHNNSMTFIDSIVNEKGKVLTHLEDMKSLEVLRKESEDMLKEASSLLNEKEKVETPLEDMKSLEAFRKETEEMLKEASSLLDEIKTGSKTKTKAVDTKEEESSSEVTIGACPVCLESLAKRPALVTVCGHIFCKECITATAKTLKKCPTCRKAISTKKIHPIYF